MCYLFCADVGGFSSLCAFSKCNLYVLTFKKLCDVHPYSETYMYIYLLFQMLMQAPIYVSRDIVLKDAIKIVYGTWRGNCVKTVYDVSLDR